MFAHQAVAALKLSMMLFGREIDILFVLNGEELVDGTFRVDQARGDYNHRFRPLKKSKGYYTPKIVHHPQRNQ
jgi:hypothetical protein